MPTKRLSKFLASAGIASRRKAEELIAQGRVELNGERAGQPQILVGPDDTVTLDGATVREERKVYFLLNKPKGFICSGAGKKRVIDLFSDIPQRLFTVGRLDVETTGLLLVTNDGHFADRVIHPRNEVQKEYLVKTRQEVGPDHLKALRTGTHVEGVFIQPLRITKVRRGTLKITVQEGRKREVRRLCAAAGLSVWQLSRIRLGNLQLGSLPLGARRNLTRSECERIFD